ncbi:MAG: galactokinase [Deltaproteobacteria bacterium]|nr:galactokinase [Deltaproteobacteria bacterium]
MEPEPQIQAFESRYGRPPQAGARAPGRVNLIGEHTDYNEGRVLPCAIDRETLVLAAAREDGRVRLVSREEGEGRAFSGDALARRGDWTDYVQAVFFALAEAGHRVGGADLCVASDVPTGSGLSSSAALGVGVATALDALFGLGLQPIDWARAAHRGESAFVGVGCGIMDQWASALGRPGAALRIDCRTGEASEVPIGGDLALLVAHSGVRRELAKAGYGDRREECFAAFRAAREAGVAGPEARALCDMGEADLPALERALPDVLFRRARHVIRDDARVDRMADALRAGALAAAGALLLEGQASLRDDFEVSTPELDLLCEVADGLPGVYGSRLTGAGFGGCTLHLVAPEAAADVAVAIADGFERVFERRPAMLETPPSAGASRLWEPKGN